MTEETGTTPNRGFYTRALSEDERMLLLRARRVQGIDEEIAVLRMRLFTLLQKHPSGIEWLLPPVAVLARLVALRYRLSPESKENLAENLTGVLNGVGVALGLEEFDDAAA